MCVRELWFLLVPSDGVGSSFGLILMSEQRVRRVTVVLAW